MKINNKIRKSLIVLVAFLSISMLSFGGNIFGAEQSTNENNNVATFTSIFDVKGVNGEYKSSDEKNDITIPFFRSSSDKTTIDKSINKLGIISAAKTLEVNEPLKNIQALFASDTVRVNNTIEYGLIWSGNDVVINSNIERNAIIFAGGTITITENATIGDDVILIANGVNINGTIKESAIVSTSKLTVNGTIEKDLRCDVENIEISGNSNVKGNLYVGTYNKDVNIKDKYPNSILNVKEAKNASKTFGSILLRCVINCLLFTLIYLIVKKATKGKVYEKMINRAQNNILFIVLSSAILLLAFPVVIILLIVLSALGLYIVMIPLSIIYAAFLIVFWMLSIFIVGSTIFEYISKKYIKEEKLSIKLVGAFCTFLSLSLLTKIPTIGIYIYFAIVMISIGIVTACIFKKDKDSKKDIKLEKKN